MQPSLPWLPPRDEALWPQLLQELRAASGPDAWAALLTLGMQQLDPAAITRLDRELTRLRREGSAPGTLEPVRLALLSSSTTHHLLPAMRLAGLRRGLLLELYEPPFGQYLQQTLEPSAELDTFAPEVVLYLLDRAHLAEQLAAGEEALQGRLELLWRTARQRWGAAVLHATSLPPEAGLLGSNEHRAPGSAAHGLNALNQWLRPAADRSGIHLLALDQAAALSGLDSWHDPALWHLAKQELHPNAAALFGDLCARLLAALRGRSRKCLVLDLDNTLWHGVVGDDGPAGIVVGQGSALGEAHLALHHFAAALRERGVLLAVCSKNDPAVARAAFQARPDLPLQLESFAAFYANWNDKAANLRAIAAELNLSPGALVFADDNPVERALIRRELPEVAVPELGSDPSRFVPILARAGYFEAVSLTEEDQQRAGQYIARRAAEQARAASDPTDLQGFLQGLGMRARVRPFDEANLARIVQLANKTNQWNLSGLRLSPDRVRAWLDDPAMVTLQVTLADRFGDHGTVALLAARVEPAPVPVLCILLWTMSCRVFGRELEHLCRNELLVAAQEHGLTGVVAPFRPTPRNGLLRERLIALGFRPAAVRSDPRPDPAVELWDLPAASAPLLSAVHREATPPPAQSTPPDSSAEPRALL